MDPGRSRVWLSCGHARRMTLPLEGLPADTTRLRLRTNLEVYWDRVAVAFAEDAPDGLVVEDLPLLSAAHGRRRAFPGARTARSDARITTTQQRAPLWDTRHPRGYYTAFGDATELVEESR